MSQFKSTGDVLHYERDTSPNQSLNKWKPELAIEAQHSFGFIEGKSLLQLLEKKFIQHL